MTGIVSGGGAKAPTAFDLPNFEAFEVLADKIQSIRERAALARESTPELVAGLDGVIALVAAKESLLNFAAKPATKAESFSYLALLMKAYTNSGLQDSTVFGRLMLDDVMSLDPPVAAVEIACRRWRQKSKFLPAISELMGEVKAVKSQVENATEFVGRLPALRDRMARDLER